MNVVLVAPQIPPNTGNVGRTCAVTGSRLHLIEPLGFSLDERHLRRAGLDYWDHLRPEVYGSWAEFEARALGGQIEKLHLFTARATRSVFDARFAPGDFLVLGQEERGLSASLLDAYPSRQLGIPLLPGQRSLNLAVAAGIAVYAAITAQSR